MAEAFSSDRAASSEAAMTPAPARLTPHQRLTLAAIRRGSHTVQQISRAREQGESFIRMNVRALERLGMVRKMVADSGKQPAQYYVTLQGTRHELD